MDFDLSARRLEAEQKKRREETLRRTSLEKAALERKRVRDEQTEMIRIEKLKLDLQREEEAIVKELEEYSLTGGVKFEEV